ncbi:MAG TPA: hypothetical protein ENI07_14975 [Desulfobacterales bacterium]|nr:hypothetical protein [Desulfobacterales bacterium]
MPKILNNLANYLKENDQLWIDRRKKEQEPKWNRNLMMIRGDDPFPEFKKDDKGGTQGKTWRWGGVINIVRVKVYAVYGMLLDILLPNGQIPFTLELSPADVDDLSGEDKKIEEKAMAKQKRAIAQQFSDRKADRQLHKSILSLLYYGLSWKKYNIKEVKSKFFKRVNNLPDNVILFDPNQRRETDRFKKVKDSKDVPGNGFRSVWSIWYDMEVDFDKLEEGQGVFERDLISLYDLRQKANKPEKDGYIKAVIERVILEHDKEALIESPDGFKPGLREVARRKLVIDNREHWIRVPLNLIEQFEKDELGSIKKGEEASVDYYPDEEETGHEVHILVETADDEIIRYMRRKDKSLPYKLNVWEENLDQSNDPGSCPPDNMVWVQRLYTGLIRGYLDNLRLAGDVILALKKKYFQDPSQVDNGISPGMTIDLTDEAIRAADAIEQIVIQNVGEAYLAGIGLVERLTDIVSMLPQLLHSGVTLPKNKPNTAFEASQLEKNAGKYIGQGVRNIDEYDIEPSVWDNYEYNMMDPDFDQEAKGNFRPVAGGFTNFKNKVLTTLQIREILGLVLSHELLIADAKTRPHLEILYESVGFNPDNFLKSEEEKRQDFEERTQIQEQARAQAIQDLMAQTQIEAQGKIALENAKTKGKVIVERVKSQGDIEEAEVEGDIKSDLQEEALQGDLIKDLASGDQGGGA